MAAHPVCQEVGGALAAFVAGGVGPRHAVLSRVFAQTGYAKAAPYNPRDPLQQPNKENRIRDIFAAAIDEPHRSRDLVDGLLAEYRLAGFFSQMESSADEAERRRKVDGLRRAFGLIDWELTADGQLHPAGVGAVAAVQGRPAIEDQLSRLRRATDDPALLLGTAKEMLESTAKYVLDVFNVPYCGCTDFDVALVPCS